MRRMLQYSNLVTEGVRYDCITWQRSVEVGVFRRGESNFRRKGRRLPTIVGCQKTRVIALSCGIKIFSVYCLVLLQSTRVTDGRTDRITTPNKA